MSEIGYVRVSSKDQLLDLQRDAMTAAGVSRLFEDEGVSGAKASRPGLDAAVDYLRAGDTLVVWRLDRLGRSTINVLVLIRELKDRGIGFRSLTEGLDTKGVYGELLLTLISAFSQMEREVLVERTRKGLDAARSRGRVGGRKPALSPIEKQSVLVMHRSREFTVKQIATHHGVSEPTIYRCVSAARPN